MNIKNNIKKNFTIVPNELILDNSLSDRARFIFVYMASKPDDWNFYMGNMCKELKLSEDTIRKYINELSDAGWLLNLGQTNENGRYSAVGYELLIAPNKPTTEKPVKENLPLGKNHTHTNTYSKLTSTLKEDVVEEEKPTTTTSHILMPNTLDVSKNTIRYYYEKFMTTNNTQKEALRMSTKKTYKEIETGCIGYVLHLLSEGLTMDTYKPDFQRHFKSWFVKYGADNIMKIDKDQVQAQFKKLNLYQDANQAVN